MFVGKSVVHTQVCGSSESKRSRNTGQRAEAIHTRCSIGIAIIEVQDLLLVYVAFGLHRKTYYTALSLKINTHYLVLLSVSIVTIECMDPDFSQRSHPGEHTAKPLTSGAPLVGRTIDADHPLAGHAANGTSHSGKSPKKHKWWPPRMPKTRKEWIITVCALIAVVGLGFAVYAIWFNNKATPPAKTVNHVTTPKPVEAPKKLYSGLMGLEITDSSINDRPITAIMIENSPDARPQSGIDQASIVFEAVAEGGITRFLTLFQENEPTYVGPVRSVRPYYVQWLLGFDAAVAHVGGSGDALRLVKETGAKDLDQFANPAPYHRISSRYAPHNMYTGIPALRDLEAKKGYGKPTYTSLVRKEVGAVSPS